MLSKLPPFLLNSINKDDLKAWPLKKTIAWMYGRAVWEQHISMNITLLSLKIIARIVNFFLYALSLSVSATNSSFNQWNIPWKNIRCICMY